tara:strand:- start:1720 stop:2565 length:846 start_codon:yes stop_codon:yes gene_type:complete
MANNNSKPSPNKFLSLLFGGAKRRREQRAANEQYEFWLDTFSQQKMNNPYAGVQNPYEDRENVYEDAKVNLQAADYAKEQSQQNMANIMNNMQASAGSSGIAGLAQVLANQGIEQARKQAIDIGEQEQANELRARAEAGRLDEQYRTAEQKRDLLERKGVAAVEEFERDKEERMLEMAAKRKGYADAAIDRATAAGDEFASAVASSFISDIRLKENITRTGVSKSGIPIYTFSYKNDDQLWSGTMAQELLELGREDAVTIMDNGYYGVRYDMIDINMIKTS